jgi:hypothetical protein
MRTKMSDKDPAKCLELVAAQTTMAQLPAWRICTASRASEEVSFFARERDREEWREAVLISSAPRFSSSPTGLSFFSSNYISSKFRWEFKNLSFPFVKAITWDEICRRRESIDAYSPIDALGTENRLPFRSRSSTIGVHQPLIRWARSRRRQRSGTFSAKRARFRTFKTNLGNQS